MERKHWIKHVEAWKESGLTRKMYCQENDVKASTFNTWVRRYRGILFKENASDLVEIKPKRSREIKSLNSRIEIAAGGFTIRVSEEVDMNLLRKVLLMVEGL